nr:hypothetical protein [uncultured Thermosynechococcus sp.]
MSDRPIALVAAADPADAAPIQDALRGQRVTSTMTYQLPIRRLC